MARCLLDKEIYRFPKTACYSSTAEEDKTTSDAFRWSIRI